jgi:hypothetical protein
VVTVAVTLGSGPVEIGGLHGLVALATRRERDGETVSGALRLEPAEAVVVIPAA